MNLLRWARDAFKVQFGVYLLYVMSTGGVPPTMRAPYVRALADIPEWSRHFAVPPSGMAQWITRDDLVRSVPVCNGETLSYLVKRRAFDSPRSPTKGDFRTYGSLLCKEIN